MFDQLIDLNIMIRGHDGWGSIFHRDINVKVNRPNILAFKKSLNEYLTKVFDNGETSYRCVTKKYLQENISVLRFIVSEECKETRQLNQVIIHLNPKDWDNMIDKLAKVIW